MSKKAVTSAGSKSLFGFISFPHGIDIFPLHRIIIHMTRFVRARRNFNVTFTLPGSKSIAARAALLCALAQGKTRLENIPTCRDFSVILTALEKLGFKLELDSSAGRVTVTGSGGKIPSSGVRVSVEDNGSALRLLTAFCTLAKGEFVIDGTPRLRQRPVKPLAEALNNLGANVTCTGDGAPVTIRAGGLPGGETDIDCSASSQFVSALLVAAPFSSNGAKIHVRNLVSKPYVQITLNLLQRFGLEFTQQDLELFDIPGGQSAQATDMTIESDASSAAYFFAAAAVCKGRAHILNLSPSSLQADVQFVALLEKMGAEVERWEDFIEVRGTDTLAGIETDLSDFPDSVPVLGAIAPFASSPTLIENVPHLRLKESDRLAAMQQELERCGVKVESGPDWLKVYPSKVHGAVVQSHNDHRIAMSMAVLGLRAGGVTIEGSECVAKSFPEFFEYLERI
jgi:3-phosphoshikimate 1-carboxyvinyltransferase